MQDQILKTRLFSQLELCTAAIDWPGRPGQKLEPDETKAYAEFKLAHGFTRASRVITAYRTALHPGTVANSAASMLHQVFNLGHKMRSYDQSKEKDQIARDYQLGSIVGVEYPQPRNGIWTVTAEEAPAIRAVAVIHKQAEKVPQVIGEHLGGRHKWSVSIEVNYSLLESGFMIGELDQAKKKQAELMADTTPDEFKSLGLGYVPVESAPEDLLACFSFEKRRVVSAWQGLPVTLFKGGINGKVHFMGVGLVRYGAEREAEVQQILASDPDRMDEIDEPAPKLLADYFQSFHESLKSLME